MTIRPKVARPRPLWRVVLLLLVVLPLLPEIVVLSVSAIAYLNGCRVDDAPPHPGADATMLDRRTAIRSPQDAVDEAGSGAASAAKVFAPTPGPVLGKACAIGPFQVSSTIRFALEVGSVVGVTFGSGLVLVWLALCYVSISKSWTGLLNRLTLALFVCLIFAFVPYFGPMISIAHLENPLCQPNEGGVGPCIMYGGDVGNIVHDNVVLGWQVFAGAPIAFGAFGLYLLFLLIAGFFSSLGSSSRKHGPGRLRAKY